MFNEKTNEVTDFERVISQCKDLFERKRKILPILALYIVYGYQEMKNKIDAEILAR
jgi:trans-2-enoyl-CoA reductase